MQGGGVKAIAPNEIPPKTPAVRVKLRRLGLNYGKLYPPGGEAKHWWRALKAALGTTSSAFVDASLAQLQGAARLPDGPVSETAINAALALIQAIEPTNEIEGALAVQMACTHLTAMAVLSRIGSAHSGHRLISAYSTAAAQLLRSYALQVETLRRMRGSGVPQLRVEQVHINSESQTIIGNLAINPNERNGMSAGR
jgi:hypothetical protein